MLPPYLVELALIALLVGVALRLQPYAGPLAARRTPKLWQLRVVGFFFLPAVVLLPSIYQGTDAPFQLALALDVALLGLVAWRITTWSRRGGWSERHLLALTSGVLGFFILVWDPLLEVAGSAGGKPTRGTTLVALTYLVLLIALARRSKQRLHLQSIPLGLVAPVAAPSVVDC